MHSGEVANPLKDINPNITGVQLIPHSRSRLKFIQSLQQNFDKREVETELVGNQSNKKVRKNVCNLQARSTTRKFKTYQVG